MKKLLIAALVCASLSNVCMVADANEGVQWVPKSTRVTNTEGTLFVTNCEEWISLRSYPSTAAPVLARIPLGDQVYVLDDSDGMASFAHVNYKGTTGYALYSYLTPHATLYRVVNCNEWISLRSAPSTDAGVLRRVPLGAYVRYVKNGGNGFTYVYYDGALGYVLNDYLL